MQSFNNTGKIHKKSQKIARTKSLCYIIFIDVKFDYLSLTLKLM